MLNTPAAENTMSGLSVLSVFKMNMPVTPKIIVTNSWLKLEIAVADREPILFSLRINNALPPYSPIRFGVPNPVASPASTVFRD